ncbi:DUF885 domain-containing protein [Promicromonospora alba]|uniref:DUF885 domain-containing protein n=1 Tax=Promicromonospora alba TaxID=1616110 RepID=A0ABV9HKK7_9MICO
MTSPTRTPTAIDAVADDYVTRRTELSPMSATGMGLPGHDHEMDDLSPAGHDAAAQANREVLAKLEGLEPVDDVDRVTLSAMRERVGLDLELHDAGEYLRKLNNIESPVQGLREVFDIMATDSVEAWENIASRMSGLPGAVDGYIESLTAAAAKGDVAAVRQVRECVTQARGLAAGDSFFTSFVTGEAASATLGERHALSGDLVRAAQGAQAAYGRLADFLEHDLAPQAPEADAVGRDRYTLWSRYFLGAKVDLDETYQWGLEELARIVAEQESVAAQIAGRGATVEEAVAVLDADPSRKLIGTAALKAWMQETSDDAITALNGTHFDVPEPVLDLECMIAPTQSGGIYYTPPSDDWSRPGRMWWSVPSDVTEFNTWREKTTVYHEGVPGHHLQCGQAVFARATLNNWRRLACWVSGHGEGWALYAERLMADLGYMDDPGDRLGMLDAQRMRAARVVFDIGVHLGLEAPEQWGGGTWTAEKGWPFLLANVNMPESFIRFEFNRYLGWPGQAPSYKVGQRLWEQTRDAAKAAAGESFDAKAFHARALNLGSVGLDTLREAMA